MKEYIIKERWKVTGEIENYECTCKSLKEVKAYIKDWVETWIGNAEDAGGKVTMATTNYRSIAKVWIEYEYPDKHFGKYTDTFILRVIHPTSKPTKMYDLRKK